MARADGYRARRSGANRGGSQAASGRDTEAKVKAAAEKINAKVEAAEAASASALESARAEIEAVAAEATVKWSQRAAGVTVEAKRRRFSGEGGIQCLSVLIAAVAQPAGAEHEPTAFGLNPAAGSRWR